jgi:hypothetical protein
MSPKRYTAFTRPSLQVSPVTGISLGGTGTNQNTVQGTSHLVTPASLASPPSLALLPAPVVDYLPLLEDLELLPLVQHVAVVVHIRYKTP